MKAMRLHKQGNSLVLEDLPIPVPGPDEVLIKVSTCAVCRTDLHVCDGEEFLSLIDELPVKIETQTFPLKDANVVLDKFRSGEI